VIVRANPAGGNFQLQRLLGGGGNNQDARLAWRFAATTSTTRAASPWTRSSHGSDAGPADVRIGREEGRPKSRSASIGPRPPRSG
jgi:hypothetical protein